LGPVLPLQVDHELLRLHVRHAGADRDDAADAFGSGRRRKLWLQPVRPATERDVGRIDRKREDLEDHLAEPGAPTSGTSAQRRPSSGWP
jgi:hypothetical protein